MFDINQLRLDIEALLRDCPDLLEDERLRTDMLDAETDINAALTMLVREIDNSEMLSNGITQRIAELNARQGRLDHRVGVLRELILKVMQSGELKRLQLPDATLSQVASQPNIVGIPDVDALPDDLVRIKREPNRAAIKQALKDGREVPHLFLSNAPPHLVIKVK